MTAAGRRIVAWASLLALALDIWLRILPVLPPVGAMTPHRALVAAVMVGIPLLQVALAQTQARWAWAKWALIGISVVWFAAAVLFLFEAALLYVAPGGLWIAGAVDTPRVRR